jgi:hypothetical protein
MEPAKPMTRITAQSVLLALLLVVLASGTGHAAASGVTRELLPEHAVSAEGPSFGGEPPWQKLKADSEGFSVALPGAPELITKTTKTLLGPVNETAYRVRNRLGEFSVELHELPGISALLAPARLVISRARDSLLADRAAEQLTFEMVQGEDYPRGIVTYRSADTKFEVEEIHLVLAGKRLFVLAAGLLRGSERPSMERFFDSFRVSKKSK